jgi:hypothetical protein
MALSLLINYYAWEFRKCYHVFGLVLEYLSEAFFENIQESVPQNLTLCFDIANAVVKFNFPRTVWNHSSPYKTCGDIETCFDYLSFFLLSPVRVSDYGPFRTRGGNAKLRN